MNFKALAIAAITAFTLTGDVAQAAPTTCMLRDSQDFTEFTCDHTIRVNANGHNVNDITFFGNGTRYDWSVVVWTDFNTNAVEYAEIFTEGKRVVTNAYRAQNGSLCVDNAGTQFCWFSA